MSQDLDELLGITEEDKRLYAAMPRDCCGITNGEAREFDQVRPCSEGRCNVVYCPCGAPRGMSWGPVGCPCQDAEVSHG